jgi:hypothetical protein
VDFWHDHLDFSCEAFFFFVASEFEFNTSDFGAAGCGSENVMDSWVFNSL